MPEADALGRYCHQVLALEQVVGDDLCQAEIDDLEAMVDGPNRRCEGELIRPGGGRMIVSATFTPLRDESGHLANLLVNVHDITRFREEEEMKSTFTSIISHELKTPVGALALLAEAILSSADDKESVQRFAERMIVESTRLSSLINDIIELSRLQGDDPLARAATFEIDSVIAQAVDEVRPFADARGIELVVMGAPGAEMVGDRQQVLTALRNLEHRGASGSEPDSGDGAGILLQVPDAFLREVVDFPTATLPATAMMKGVWEISSPKNCRVMTCRCLAPST